MTGGRRRPPVETRHRGHAAGGVTRHCQWCMSDLTYKIIHHLGYPAFWTSSSPVVLHRDRVPRRGAFILAANHLSPFDVPCLMATVPRNLDFMSVVEFL